MHSTTPLFRRSVEPRAVALLAVALGPVLEGLLGGGLDRWLFLVVAVAGGVGQGLAAAGAVGHARSRGGGLAWAAAAAEAGALVTLALVLVAWAGVFFAQAPGGAWTSPLAQRTAVGALLVASMLSLRAHGGRAWLACGLALLAWGVSWPAAQAVVFTWSSRVSAAWPHITAALGLAVLATLARATDRRPA